MSPVPNVRSRRKISNFVIDPTALMRLSVPFIVLIFTSVFVILFMHWQLLSAVSESDAFASGSTQTTVVLNDIVSKITVTGMIGIGGIGIVCIFLWIFYSHRVFGPMVPIRRHIQNLTAGDYKSRVRLRPGDEFKDIAVALNVLAEKLEKEISR